MQANSPNFTVQQVINFLELSCLQPASSPAAIREKITNGKQLSLNRFLVYPSLLPADYLADSQITTIIGGENGKEQPLIKAAAAKFAADCGAQEIILVPDLSNLLNQAHDNLRTELVTLQEAITGIPIYLRLEPSQLLATTEKLPDLLADLTPILNDTGMAGIHLDYPNAIQLTEVISSMKLLSKSHLRLTIQTANLDLEQVLDLLLAGISKITLAKAADLVTELTKVTEV